MHLFRDIVRIGRSRSSNVDAFRTNRKRIICDFLLVRHSNLGTILHGFWDTATYWLQTSNFSYPCLIQRPRSLYVPSHGAIGQWGPHDRSLSRIDTIPACDRQTDRQTERGSEGIYRSYSTALCIANTSFFDYIFSQIQQEYYVPCFFSVYFSLAEFFCNIDIVTSIKILWKLDSSEVS